VDKFRISGPCRLLGEVAVSGAKNAALPALAAALLTSEPLRITNLPRVADIRTMRRLLEHTGAHVSGDEESAIVVEARNIASPDAPYDLVKTMRASVLVLGPLLARSHAARISLPGGCAIGVRPINLHVAALERLGARIRLEHGYVEAAAEYLTGATIRFDTVTVTGTENVLLAATMARGVTRIENAACEPEVSDLADLLGSMGARIVGAGTSTIEIEGIERLHGAEHAVIPDRIEAGTYALAAAATRGRVRVAACRPEHLRSLTDTLRSAGVSVAETPSSLEVDASGEFGPVRVSTAPYPGFPTDLQAQIMAFATQGRGLSTVEETIFENRFQHVPELARMGAEIRIEGRTATVAGPVRLSGATVMATDLRASASLVIAGLAAEGETVVDRIYHLDRGYQRMEEKLTALGARVRRIS
jgi:UDP-N-acetylglucosamine 1-carboxyvinyltransferase